MKPHTEEYRGFKITATHSSAYAERNGYSISAPNLHTVKQQIDRWWAIEAEKAGAEFLDEEWHRLQQ